MPMLLRATTTSNAQGRKQRLVLPAISTYKSDEIDVDYLQALKVFLHTFLTNMPK